MIVFNAQDECEIIDWPYPAEIVISSEGATEQETILRAVLKHLENKKG